MMLRNRLASPCHVLDAVITISQEGSMKIHGMSNTCSFSGGVKNDAQKQSRVAYL